MDDIWPEGEPSWLPGGAARFDERRLADIFRYEADLAAQLRHKHGRFLHSLSVGLTAERLATAYGVDPYLARVAGILHDWSKADDPAELTARAEELGVRLSVDLSLVEPLLHGMVAARILPARYPELPDSVWQAVDRHTLGAADMSPLDIVLFVSDGIEPRRKAVPAIERQRAMVGVESLEDLFMASFCDGISYIVATRRYLYPGTIAIYNDLVTTRPRP